MRPFTVIRPWLAEAVLTTIKKGAHVLVEGSLISPTYGQANVKGKKAKTATIASWSIRDDVVGKLDRGEPEPKHRRPVRTLSCCRPTRVSRRRSDAALQRALRHPRISAAKVGVRRLLFIDVSISD